MDYHRYYVVNETPFTLQRFLLYILLTKSVLFLCTFTNFDKLKKYYIPCFDKALLFISPVSPNIIVMMIT